MDKYSGKKLDGRYEIHGLEGDGHRYTKRTQGNRPGGQKGADADNRLFGFDGGERIYGRQQGKGDAASRTRKARKSAAGALRKQRKMNENRRKAIPAFLE